MSKIICREWHNGNYCNLETTHYIKYLNAKIIFLRCPKHFISLSSHELEITKTEYMLYKIQGYHIR